MLVRNPKEHDGRYAVPNATGKVKDKPKDAVFHERVFLDENNKPINAE